MTLAKAAEVLECSADYLRVAVNRGSLPATKLGRDWLLEEKDVAFYKATRSDQRGKRAIERRKLTIDGLEVEVEIAHKQGNVRAYLFADSILHCGRIDMFGDLAVSKVRGGHGDIPVLTPRPIEQALKKALEGAGRSISAEPL